MALLGDAGWVGFRRVSKCNQKNLISLFCYLDEDAWDIAML